MRYRCIKNLRRCKCKVLYKRYSFTKNEIYNEYSEDMNNISLFDDTGNIIHIPKNNFNKYFILIDAEKVFADIYNMIVS